MKHYHIKTILLTILIFFHPSTFSSILSGTLIKTPKGLVPVETITTGDILVGYFKDTSQAYVSVLDISSSVIETAIIIKTTKGKICTTPDELFYDPIKDTWIKSQDITQEMHFLDSQFNKHACLGIEYIKIPPTKTYKIFTSYPHNFFAFKEEFLVHNFLPFIGLGATWFFGAGALKFGGINIIVSVASIIFGITLFKKQAKSGGSFHVTTSYGGNGGGANKDPNDDEENQKNKKRKFNNISKSEFFKKIKNQYEYCKNGIYKLKPGAKGIENAEYLQWDHLHGDVEAYAKNRMHLGSVDPETLTLYKASRAYKI
jgi:hypothetical protein